MNSNPPKNTEEKLHLLMYSLIYPAVLGAMIVFVLGDFRGRELFEQAAIILLLLYFCSQHLEGQLKTARPIVFLFDILEVALLYQMFVTLNVAPAQFPEYFQDWSFWTQSNEVVNTRLFFLVLALAFLIPPIPRLVRRMTIAWKHHKCPNHKVRNIIFSHLSINSILSFCVVIFAVVGFWFPKPALVLCFIPLLIYIFALMNEKSCKLLHWKLRKNQDIRSLLDGRINSS